MMTTKVDRKTYEECRAMVDERKAHWHEEGTPDADRALVKALLAQVGAWEVEAAKARAALDDATRDVYLVTGQGAYSDYGIDLCRLPRGMELAELVAYLAASDRDGWGDWDETIEYAFRGSVLQVGRNKYDDGGEVSEFAPRVQWDIGKPPTSEALSVFPSRVLRKTLANLNATAERWFDRSPPEKPVYRPMPTEMGDSFLIVGSLRHPTAEIIADNRAARQRIWDDNFRAEEERWGKEMARRDADREKHAAAVAVVERAIALAEEREAR